MSARPPSIHYDPETGVFSRPVTGSLAGYIRPDGYVEVGVGRKKYLGHRLAWKLAHGCDPKGYIDHINRNRSDNRICNLRDVTPTESQWNLPCRGRPNVGVRERRGRWEAHIKMGGRQKHLGVFATEEEAREARRNAEIAHFGAIAEGWS